MDEAVDFLLDLEMALHSVSIPADRAEDLLTRAADRLGTTLDIAIFQNYVAAELQVGAGHQVRIKRIPFEGRWDLWRTEQVILLAQAVGEGALDLAQARAQLDRIVAQPPLYSRFVVVLGYAGYAAVVTGRIGGGVLDMAAAAIIGLLAGLIQQGAARYRSVQLQQSFVAGALGLPLAGLLAQLMPIHPGKALFGGVALLIPAMVLTLAVHEIANDALESGVLRLVHSLLRFLMLGLGIAVSLRLWQAFVPESEAVPSSALPGPVIIALLALGSVALAFCLQARLRDVGWVMAGMMLAYGTQLAMLSGVGETASAFGSAFAVGVAGQLFARATGRVPALITLPGLFQLIPGFLGTRTVMQSLLHHTAEKGTSVADVLGVALQIVTGIFVASVLFRSRRSKPPVHPIIANT